MTRVRVEAPARLHFGMIDVGSRAGRRFGGLGAAITRPVTVVEAEPAGELTVEGDHAEVALGHARRFLGAGGLEARARLRVASDIPRHAGLGSGTRLALAVAAALARLGGSAPRPDVLARQVGRGERSAVGLWTFARGGLVIEGGRRPGRPAPAPLLLRQPLPAGWRCLLVLPAAAAGLSGEAERAAFARLDPPPEEAPRIAHLILMRLLPALVEADLGEFGAALTELQRRVGECFRPVQGGCFGPGAAELVEALLAWGAAGAGQSSWGPAVFALTDAGRAPALAERVRREIDRGVRVEVVAFANRGARVRRR